MEALIEEIESFGSSGVHAYSGKFTGGIYLAQIPKEIAQCIAYLRDGDKSIESYLEIGSLAGGTAYVFNKFFDIKTTVLIDDNTREESKFRSSNLADIDYVEFIGNSQSPEAFNFVKDIGCTFDIVLIDGDHSYDGVSSDVKNYSRFVSPGGYLIMHDVTGNFSVRQVFDGIRASGNFESVVEFADYTQKFICGIGVIKRNG